MSQENFEIVRQDVSTSSEPPGRRLEERFFLRLPRARVAVTRATLALSPRSRIRRFLLRRVVQLGVEAHTRRDYDAAFGTYHSDVELSVPKEVVVLGSFPDDFARA